MDRWQTGQCGIYALALMRAHPGLRLGALSETQEDGWLPFHFFAHDDAYAYDSAGRHRLPYLGLEGQADACELEIGPLSWWGIPDDESGPEGHDSALEDAREHIRRHHPWLA